MLAYLSALPVQLSHALGPRALLPLAAWLSPLLALCGMVAIQNGAFFIVSNTNTHTGITHNTVSYVKSTHNATYRDCLVQTLVHVLR